MTTRAGVGYSDSPDSKAAGAAVADAAMTEAGVDTCDLALLFSTPKHDPAQLRDGVRSVIGDEPRLIGGYAVGIITKDQLGYGGNQVGLAVISSDTVQLDMFVEGGLPNNEYNVGLALGQQIKNTSFDGDPNILLLYDSIKERRGTGLALNVATPLLKGMEQAMGTWPTAAGAGMLGDVAWNPTYQWFDDEISQGTAMALVASGSAKMNTIIMHGCRPSSGYHTVTKSDGNTVLEIDGKPAIDFIGDLLGPGADRSWEEYPLFVTLGINRGGKFDEFEEDNYANRLCMDVDRERGGLIMFEPDLLPGTEVQIMRRDIDFDAMANRAEHFISNLKSESNFLALYFDCAGRAMEYSGLEREEAEIIQNVVGSKMPLLGVYSGVEIGPVRGKLEPLDWNGVLCVYSEQ